MDTSIITLDVGSEKQEKGGGATSDEITSGGQVFFFNKALKNGHYWFWVCHDKTRQENRQWEYTASLMDGKLMDTRPNQKYTSPKLIY